MDLMDKINELKKYMIQYEKGCPKRINHFLKVHSFAKIIAESENFEEPIKFIIETASILHDVGIKPSLEKYQSSAGHHQEIEGPPKAKEILIQFGFSDEITERVCYLIANHHTYSKIDGEDYQALIEADFLVNIFEDELNKENILTIKKKYFKTNSGISLLENLYLY